MALFNFNKPETREFNYKPRYYTPEEKRPTGDHRRDFANEMHREWNSHRKHDKNDKHFAWLPLISMVFFALILAYVFYKFFS